MSKQDRQGVRKASDIEQKYDLLKLKDIAGYTSGQSEQISKLTQSLSQFTVEVSNKIRELNEQIEELARFDTEVEDKNTEVDNAITEVNDKITELDNAITEVNDAITEANDAIIEVNDKMHPIGSVYISLDESEPDEMYGGTWELIAEGKLVVGSGAESDDLLQTDDTCYIWTRTE